jgi:hypothetical protein
LTIYIYGNKRFQKKTKSVLNKANILNDINTIDTLEKLKETIKEHQEDIFLIDNDKIINNSFLSDKIKFLYPKDAIKRDFLDKYGVGDICFNSMDGFVQYIKSRLQTNTKNEETTSNTDLIIDEYEFNDSIDLEDLEEMSDLKEEETSTRDLANIIAIEDIQDDEMAQAVKNLKD